MENIEQFPTEENIPSRMELIEKLEANPLDPEVLKTLHKWYKARKDKVKTIREEIILDIDMVQFYNMANNPEWAWKFAKSAYENALSHGENDLKNEILKISPELENSNHNTESDAQGDFRIDNPDYKDGENSDFID